MYIFDEWQFLFIEFIEFLWKGFASFVNTIQEFFSPSPPPQIRMDPIAHYLEKQKTRFLTFLECTNRNENIPPLFYSAKEFHETVQDVDNEIEPVWRRRILFESTPRGNILMLYDPFRMGFCYYMDTSTISYPILNSVAMKFVQIYKCADFFMDNEFPFESPLISIYNEKTEKKKDPEEKEKKRQEFMRDLLADGPFIKRKKAVIEEKLSSSSLEKSSLVKEEKQVEYHRNKFVFLGKMRNYDFLKKETASVQNKENNTISSQFSEVFRYQDYKKMVFKKNQ